MGGTGDSTDEGVISSPFCPACGAASMAGSRFCARCGHNLTAVVAASADDSPPANHRQSTEVVPAVLAAPLARVGKGKRNVPLQLTVAAVMFSLLVALTYLSVSDIDIRMLFVNMFGAATAIATAAFLVLLTVRLIRHRPSKVWSGVLLAVLVLETGMSGGLNAYADSFAVATTSVIQDYYAEVAVAASLGNAVAARQAPVGVTFDTVHDRAYAAESALAALDVPAGLSDYRSSVQDWAAQVTLDAGFGGNSWANVPSMPDPIDLAMTADQANTAVATSVQQIATLDTFSKRADAFQDLEGRRYIGARLDALSYWLEAIYTSADPNWVQANLRFVEPFGYYAAPYVLTSMHLAASTTRAWPQPRHWANCSSRGFVPCNIPTLQGPLRQIIRGSVGMENKYSNPTPAMTTADRQLEAIPGIIDGSGGQPLTGGGVVSQAPPPGFAAKCRAQGGTFAGVQGDAFGAAIYDRSRARVPTSEHGWTCLSAGSKCFDFLTDSGVEYRGSQSGQSGCPEQGLVPVRPINSIIRNGGGGKSPVTAPSSVPLAPTWDGTYRVTSGTASCHTHVPDPNGGPPFDSTSSQASPTATFVISNNTLPGGGHISADGHAAFSVPVPGYGTVAENFIFLRDTGGGVRFTGTESYSYPIGGGSITCSGSVSGKRN